MMESMAAAYTGCMLAPSCAQMAQRGWRRLNGPDLFPCKALLDVPKLGLGHCINGQQDYTGNKEPDPGSPIKCFVQNLLEPKQSCLLVRNADVIQKLSVCVSRRVCGIPPHPRVKPCPSDRAQKSYEHPNDTDQVQQPMDQLRHKQLRCFQDILLVGHSYVSIY